MKTFDEFINEGYHERFHMDDYYKALKTAHPRSGFVDKFINHIKSLLSGKTNEVARSEFRLKMGEQWGNEWVDSLVDHGWLLERKKGISYCTRWESREGS